MHNSAVMLLYEISRIFPEHIAIEDKHNKLTYEEYHNSALSVGSLVISSQQTWTHSVPIAVYLPKGYECLISFMGILYSGNTYVPIDASMPLPRLEKLLDNLLPEYIITNEKNKAALRSIGIDEEQILLFDKVVKHPPDVDAALARVSKISDADPIYIMFTSGSTGIPKGVVITHRGVLDYAHWVVETFDISSESVFGNQAPFHFDNSILDIYSCLLTGAKFVLIPEQLFQFPAKLPQFIAQQRIDTIFWVPTVMINVANSGAFDSEELALPCLRRVLFCGEEMPNKSLNIWRKRFPGPLYANLYGPTEITDVCTFYIVDREYADSDPLPIGAPCKNTSVLVLTENGMAAANKEIGELCILGSGLALGYWNNPEATRKAFTSNPLNPHYEEKMYRTGDLVYVNEEGLIIFMGRMDSQIKHKGNRIEMGEIETAAKSIEGIKNACVLYDRDKQEIVMFVVCTDILLTDRQINKELLKLLPIYMLPGRIVYLEDFPLNPNGKIDRPLLKTMMQP